VALKIANEDLPLAERLDLMDGLRQPIPVGVMESLLLVMKDRSQQAFLMVPDASDLGYHVSESPFDGPDRRSELRWTAIMALERLGMAAALPDLISALYDRHPVVRHHAARALWSLGSTAGIPVLLKGLEERAFGNETANRILKEITGQDHGFDTDNGWTLKLEAIDRWKTSLAKTPPQPKRSIPHMGEDPDLDRRMRFLVDVLGQHQFLFMEQARRNLSALGDLAIAHIEATIDGGGSNQQLRAYAVQVLENIGNDRAALALAKRLKDADGAVRSRALLALGRLKRRELSSAVIALLGDDDESVQMAAVRAMGSLGTSQDLKALAPLEASGGHRMKLLLAMTRVRLGDVDPVPFVLERLRSGSVDERIDLAEILLEWKGTLHGYDADKPGSEQPEALTALTEAIRVD